MLCLESVLSSGCRGIPRLWAHPSVMSAGSLEAYETKLLSLEHSTKQSFALTNLLSSLPCSAEFEGRAVIRKLISATAVTGTQSSRQVFPRPGCVRVRTEETPRWESWTLEKKPNASVSGTLKADSSGRTRIPFDKKCASRLKNCNHVLNTPWPKRSLQLPFLAQALVQSAYSLSF